MELNGVNSYYTSYEAASNKKTAVKDTDNSTASKNTRDVAATYESSSDKSSSSTSSVKSNAANPALVAKLKADSDNRMQQLQSLVTTMFKKQGITIGTADDMWKALASGNFTPMQTLSQRLKKTYQKMATGALSRHLREFSTSHRLLPVMMKKR